MKKNFLLFFGGLFGMSIYTQAQTISTIAGNGTAGYTADGVAATSTQLNGPGGIAVDAAGNVYIADTYNNRVRKISTTGVITTVAGTGVAGYMGDGSAATAAQLKNPGFVVVDNSGNLYITDVDNNKIRKVSTTGIITTLAGTGSLGFSGDGGPATDAKLYKPQGIHIDAAGNLLIADNFNHRVRRVDPSGIITTLAGKDSIGFGGDGGGANYAKLNAPAGVTKDAAGNYYIADKTNNRIRKITAAGVISTIAGKDTMGFSGDGGPASAAKLNKPVSLKVDAANNIYFVDYGNNRIRKINPAGVISTVAGSTAVAFAGDGGPATAASFTWASDIAMDAAGNIYIADQGNNRVRKISMSSTSVASVSGGNATLTLFPNPSSGTFTIQLPKPRTNTVVTIEDITGRIVATETITTSETSISHTLSYPVSGLYIVKAYTDDAVYCGKLLVQ